MTTRQTTSKNLQELITAIKSVCNSSFPDLPEELAIQIILLEDKFFDDRTEVRNRIEKIVDNYIQKVG